MAIIGNFAIVLIVPYIHCLVDLAVRQATTPITRFGESLSWDSEKQAIYLVDVLGSTVYQHVYGSNATTSTKIDSETIGAAIPIRDRIGEFIVPANQDVLKLEWDGTHDTGKVTKLNINFEFANNEQFYSAKADAKGRLWVGTYQVINREKYEFVKGGGSLYMITIKENSVEIEKKLSNLTFPTGLDWTSDNRFMYHADITERKIKKYTFDIDSGDLGDWEVFFDLADHPHLSGSIDGLIVKNNLVTFALYHGSALVDVDQDTRKIIYVVPTPVPQHTSLVVGGPHLDTVYVASSDFLLTEDEKQLNPFDSQAVFAYTGLRYWGVASHKVSLR
ncbi:putative sugar lactone lactonase YvrE [Cylas formicarius]|uniref:putative sugar lactone lactonase YvrE n=1 Tax=Cylas formicarius TaxID=197179 RepID=UPI00295869BA|nr:putative sugar lactone lactonase YvrE [Cylas formicarius]